MMSKKKPKRIEDDIRQTMRCALVFAIYSLLLGLAHALEAANATEFQLPRLHLQVGNPRTATTLQFATVCAAVAVKNRNNPDAKIDCGFSNPFFRLLGHAAATDPQNHFVVVKAHKLYNVAESVLSHMFKNRTMRARSPVWVWETTSNFRRPAADRQLQPWQPYLHYVMSVDTSSISPLQDGYQVERQAYERVFHLSSAESQMLYDWLEKWDVLRQCCGVQMSDAWRAHLNASAPQYYPRDPASERSRRAVAFCASQDITAVEKSLMSTTLYKLMHHRVAMLERPSEVDGPLTGSYCETCNQNITKYGRGFNQHCVG